MKSTALSGIRLRCSQPVVLVLVVGVWGLCGVTSPAFAEQLEVSVVDDRISINAEAVGLGQLLSMLDRAIGTDSSVPVELAGRNVSVEFADLGLDDAVDKIFEGLGLDYIVVGRHRILVTAVSGVVSNTSGSVTSSNSVATTSPSLPSSASVPSAPPMNPFQAPGFGGQAAANPGRAILPGAQQPAVVQTPFGPMVNPRANPNQAQPAGPLSMPGQSGFPGGGTSANLPGLSSNQSGNGQPSIFGNTSPTILDLNKQQPATQPPFPGMTPTSPGSTFPQTNPTIPPTTNPNFPPPQQ